jgi:hypothetical protein
MSSLPVCRARIPISFRMTFSIELAVGVHLVGVELFGINVFKTIG